jgi:hypothetical protein
MGSGLRVPAGGKESFSAGACGEEGFSTEVDRGAEVMRALGVEAGLISAGIALLLLGACGS